MLSEENFSIYFLFAAMHSLMSKRVIVVIVIFFLVVIGLLTKKVQNDWIPCNLVVSDNRLSVFGELRGHNRLGRIFRLNYVIMSRIQDLLIKI